MKTITIKAKEETAFNYNSVIEYDSSKQTAKTLLSLVLIFMFAFISVYGVLGIVFSHTIKVYAGTEELGSITVRQGDRFDLPDLQKIGHTFAGWYKDPELKNKYDPGKTVIKRSLTLYAKWLKNRYTITVIDPTGINTPIAITQEFGTAFYFKAPLILWGEEPDNFLGIAPTYYNPSEEDIIKAEDLSTTLQHIPSQNVTYYYLWNEFQLPDAKHLEKDSYNVRIRFNLQQDLIMASDVSLKFNDLFDINTSEFISLPNVLGVDVSNSSNGYFTFHRWSLYKNDSTKRSPNERLFRDGEHVDLGEIVDSGTGWAYTNERGEFVITITFYAQWNEVY